MINFIVGFVLVVAGLGTVMAVYLSVAYGLMRLGERIKGNRLDDGDLMVCVFWPMWAGLIGLAGFGCYLIGAAVLQ